MTCEYCGYEDGAGHNRVCAKTKIEQLEDENRKMNTTIVNDALEIFALENENRNLQDKINNRDLLLDMYRATWRHRITPA